MRSASLEHPLPSWQQKAETVLRAHPGVRETAAVLRRDGNSAGQTLFAYVVPDEDFIADTLAGGEQERKRIQKWRKTFDLSQLAKQSHLSEPGFDIAGWTSSYTRQPIPAEHMREWVDLTVQELQSFGPRDILEIGCGTGLLLLRLARGCARYVGEDISAAVIRKLRKQMDELGGDWSNVTLLERSAENFDSLAEKSFDTVILNSVVKYFPSVSYLLGVLAKALRVVKPGGRVFIGDVRNLVLLEAYAASVELYQAPPSLTLAELRERAHRRVEFEEQLVISPAFFTWLPQRFPNIACVQVCPNSGRFDNEMTRFRYNAVLHVEPHRQTRLEISPLNWSEHRLTPDSIAVWLRERKPESLAVKNVANRRIEKDIETLARLGVAGGSTTVGELKQSLERWNPQGIDPHKMWTLGAQLGYLVDISWAASMPDGSYDVIFRQAAESGGPLREVIASPQTSDQASSPARLANVPGRVALRDNLISQLLEHCRRNLPGALVPSDVVLLDALPLTAEGQLDVDQLPLPANPAAPAAG